MTEIILSNKKKADKLNPMLCLCWWKREQRPEIVEINRSSVNEELIKNIKISLKKALGEVRETKTQKSPEVDDMQLKILER